VTDINGNGISLRQIRDDIKYMRDRVFFDAPIVAYPLVGKKCFYRYSDPDFSIYKNELSVEDLSKLRSTIEMLGRYRGLPANAWLEEVISNLEYRFGVKANSENLISFDQNNNLKGLEFLSSVIEYTIDHQPVVLIYKTYEGKEYTPTLHPYYVKQYNNRWFIFGWNEEEQKLSNYALDRIVDIKPSNIEFKKNETINFEQYFSDIVGVSYPSAHVKKETIILRFSPKRFPYVVSKPIHQSQKIRENSTYEIEIEVKPNKELCQQIFSFIPDVEVVSPQWFRDDIKRKIEENLKKYSAMQNDCTDE
jgi:predicted DNA-binding transcriptional regulator YafY